MEVLLIGPNPPPIGGVSNFIENIIKQKDFGSRYKLNLYRTGKSKKNELLLKSLVHDISLIIRYPCSRVFRNSDIIHIHTSSYLGFYRNAFYVGISKFFKKRVILHVHGAEFHLFYRNSKPFQKFLIRGILNLPDIIIVTSQSWISIINEIINSINPIMPIPNGFDPVRFYPMQKDEARSQLGISKDKKVLATIGHLESYKGHKCLVEAMKIVSKSRSDVVVYIIGNGSLKHEIQDLIKKYDLNSVVLLVGGNKPACEILLSINAADFFVLPSLSEGNPTVMFEALGCGKPFVGTRVGGVPGIIIDDKLGILVEPGDPEDLARAILQALETKWDEEYIREYAEQFTWENIAKQVIDVYESLMRRYSY